jgi:hypothetical protein
MISRHAPPLQLPSQACADHTVLFVAALGMPTVRGSFGRLFLLLILIWDYSALSSFLIEVFALSSNLLAMQGKPTGSAATPSWRAIGCRSG